MRCTRAANGPGRYGTADRHRIVAALRPCRGCEAPANILRRQQSLGVLSFHPKIASREPFHVLVLGAHSDDIELGCGATLLRLLEERSGLHVRWCVFGATGDRASEARSSAEALLSRATAHRIDVFEFRDGFFPSHSSAIKERFEKLKSEVEPDLIFTHHGDDRHQDHRVIAELTWNTFRNHFIL